MRATEENSGIPSRPAPRERIVSSACELFRQHGIRGIGVDAIAEAADTNKMTLYRHFGSKDDLICEALRHTSEKAAAMWEELEAANPGDARSQLEGWVEARARCLCEEPFGCDFANAAVELKEQGHPAHTVIENFKNQQRQRLSDLCRSAAVDEPEVLADTLSMLLEGARVSRLATGSEGPSMRFVRACEAAIVSFAGPRKA
ncbi:AcrR family transcriptional regulator [Pararhizobium capsulatum DSM 1112]|uniref:AcrR family transcriptional regulator n=1 Tax=Pararhizobium capsulatum DSM 1112 TaxID=1121113 RepID=A0ABU0BYQ2_9HYPH|nr:TetR/AcrR family transcriptional regulator [Pararhizobium capsulatum]MDQ0322565.1 AcrR family transcriptional regulator [Pararhizobium capsulatum DSM 1112]